MAAKYFKDGRGYIYRNPNWAGDTQHHYGPSPKGTLKDYVLGGALSVALFGSIPAFVYCEKHDVFNKVAEFSTLYVRNLKDIFTTKAVGENNNTPDKTQTPVLAIHLSDSP